MTALSEGVWPAHRGHVLLLAVWILAVGVILLVMRARTTRELRRSAWIWAVAVSGAGAGGIHVLVIDEHFAESWLYGTFFVVLAVLQVGWSVAIVVRPGVAVVTAGAIASLAVVVLWLFTRTIAIPLGPAAGTTEPVGIIDTVCSALELITAGCAWAALASGRPRVPATLASVTSAPASPHLARQHRSRVSDR